VAVLTTGNKLSVGMISILKEVVVEGILTDEV